MPVDLGITFHCISSLYLNLHNSISTGVKLDSYADHFTRGKLIYLAITGKKYRIT